MTTIDNAYPEEVKAGASAFEVLQTGGDDAVCFTAGLEGAYFGASAPTAMPPTEGHVSR